MFSFHKPKIYRSNSGCCICRAKSSSSRFTDSKRYEVEFEKCFRIREKRSGEICNACVLLVKRWKKLPEGTNRHWHHVVDARAGPGIKSSMKIKNKLSPTHNKYKSPLRSKKSSYSAVASPGNIYDELSVNEDSCDKDMFGVSDSEESDVEDIPRENSQRPNKRKQSDPRISPFLDLSYWKKTEVCCGIIFKGLNGEVLLDPQLFHPCYSCHKNSPRRGGEIRRSRSTDDTESNSSSNSYGDSEFLETGCGDNDTESLPALENSAALSLAEFQCSNEFSQPPALAMEC